MWVESSINDAGKKVTGKIRINYEREGSKSCSEVPLSIEIRFRRKGEPLNGQITPASGRIVNEPETGQAFVEGQIFMIAPLGTTLEVAERIAERTGGIIIGGRTELGFYQIYYPGKNLGEIRDIAAQIKKEHPEMKWVGPEKFDVGVAG